jgi:hypothetical protein
VFAVTWTSVPTGPAEGSRLDIVIAADTLGENDSIIRLNDNMSVKDMSCSIPLGQFFIVFPLSLNEWFEQLYR